MFQLGQCWTPKLTGGTYGGNSAVRGQLRHAKAEHLYIYNAQPSIVTRTTHCSLQFKRNTAHVTGGGVSTIARTADMTQDRDTSLNRNCSGVVTTKL